MAENSSEPAVDLVETIIQHGEPHAGKHIKAPRAVANKAIKKAAAKLQHDEMTSSPTHRMKRQSEGGLASAVQVAAQHTARPDLNPVVAAVHDRVRHMQEEAGGA